MTNPRDWLHFALGLLTGGVVIGVVTGVPRRVDSIRLSRSGFTLGT